MDISSRTMTTVTLSRSDKSAGSLGGAQDSSTQTDSGDATMVEKFRLSFVSLRCFCLMIADLVLLIEFVVIEGLIYCLSKHALGFDSFLQRLSRAYESNVLQISNPLLHQKAARFSFTYVWPTGVSTSLIDISRDLHHHVRLIHNSP